MRFISNAKYDKDFIKFFNCVCQYNFREQEELKEIKGFDSRYFVSNYGDKVISICGKVWIERVLDIDKDGYLQVQLYKNGKPTHERIHRLVAEAFIINDQPEIKTIVHHKDFNKQNNHYTNLVYVSLEEHNKIHQEERKESK